MNSKKIFFISLLLLQAVMLSDCKSKKKTASTAPKKTVKKSTTDIAETPKEESSRAKFKYFEGSISELRAKAVVEKRTIILDFYTTWCGPCKKMTKEIESDEQASKWIKEKYLFYKINAESFDGVDLAQKMKVNSYPTYVFVSPDWRVKYRFTGYTPVEQFNYYLSQYVSY